MQHRAPLSHWSPRLPQLCYGEEDYPSDTRHLFYTIMAVTSTEETVVIHSFAQVGRVEAYITCGSAFQTAVLPLSGWARCTTTLPLATVKMVPQNQHLVMLHQQNKSCLLLPKLLQAPQVTDFNVTAEVVYV